MAKEDAAHPEQGAIDGQAAQEGLQQGTRHIPRGLLPTLCGEASPARTAGADEVDEALQRHRLLRREQISRSDPAGRGD